MLSCASFAATAPLPLNWWSRGVGGGGYFCTPSLSPLDPNTLYISTDMGTVFHSANGAAFWDSYAFGNLTGGPLARMQFTSDPAVLYVLDCRVDYVQYLGGAVFKSVDGGGSWFRLTSDPCLNNDATRKKLRADPTRTDRLVLGHDRGLWFSGDGGTNWTAFYSPGSGCYLVDTFFAGPNVFAAGNFGLFVSTNNGSSFGAGALTGIGTSEKIAGFAGAARNGQIRLYCLTTDAATVDAADDNSYPGLAEMIYSSPASYKGLYACDWGAGGWSKCTNGIRSLDVLAFVGAANNRPERRLCRGREPRHRLAGHLPVHQRGHELDPGFQRDPEPERPDRMGRVPGRPGLELGRSPVRIRGQPGRSRPGGVLRLGLRAWHHQRRRELAGALCGARRAERRQCLHPQAPGLSRYRAGKHGLLVAHLARYQHAVRRVLRLWRVAVHQRRRGLDSRYRRCEHQYHLLLRDRRGESGLPCDLLRPHAL